MPRRDYSKVAFAATGDTNSIPSTVQPDGSVSLPSGFGFDYQRDNGAGGGTPDPLAKNIGRADTNGILNEITASIGEIQQNGYPIWVTTAAPYPINAEVRYAVDGKNYRSTIANNNSTPGANADWLDITVIAGRYLGTQRFATAGTFTYIPSAGAKTVRVKVQAGGAAGGGAQTVASGSCSVGSGGGAGGYAEGIFTAAALTGQTVTVGAGGVGVLTATGNNGGASSVGAIISATGGGGGIIQPATATFPTQINGGQGGSGTSGTIVNAVGGSGYVGTISAASNATSGIGGASAFSQGAQLRVTSGNGTPAVFGAGGGGAVAIGPAGANYAGGQGGAGIILFEEYS